MLQTSGIVLMLLLNVGNSFLTPDLKLDMSPDFLLGRVSGIVSKRGIYRKDRFA
jgi:hypothetical protein